jgi:hypothetical protein
MQKNLQQKSAMANHGGNAKKAPRKPMMKPVKLIYSGFDDFQERLSAMKEKGGFIISGRRIC